MTAESLSAKDAEIERLRSILRAAAEFVRDPEEAVVVHAIYLSPAARLRQAADRLERQAAVARMIRKEIG